MGSVVEKVFLERELEDEYVRVVAFRLVEILNNIVLDIRESE